MRLSTCNPLYKKRFWFLRFGNEKSHLESIQNGNLRYSPSKTYVDIEKRTGEKGIGDKYEAAVVVSEVNISVYHEDTDELIAQIPAEETTLTISRVSQIPVFCLYAFNGDNLEVIHEDEESYYVKTVFEEEDKNLLQKDFGEHVLLIVNTPLFLERVAKGMQSNGLFSSHGIVNYDDYSRNSEARWASYKKDERNSLFWKDARYFKHQKEYRLILNTLITEPTFYDIGSIRDITAYMTREQLFNEGFRLRINKNRVK
ncbi:hypothetical protein ACFW1J_26150 [Priestia aryabhattai]|uniref:hypothetical protein n=1 Tax=Priestia aryabhattai TaxID=412384 RepID=UPI003670E63F